MDQRVLPWFRKCNKINWKYVSHNVYFDYRCGQVAAEPPCYVSEDLSLPYPACCPKAFCPGDEGYKGKN